MPPLRPDNENLEGVAIILVMLLAFAIDILLDLI